MKWYTSGLIIVAASAVTWSCASTMSIAVDPPAHWNPDSLRDSILASAPHDSMFSPFDGDEQYVRVPTFPMKKTYGIVYPHRAAHTTPLHHRKVLARVFVDRNYRGLVANKWHYWVAADTSAAGTGKWVSLWVAPGEPLRVRRLTIRDDNHAHPHAKAAWYNQSAAAPWVTCSGDDCCCEGSKCDLRSAILF